MTGPDIIDLNDVIPTLARGGAGHVEFYEPMGTARKTHQELWADVRAAAAALARRGLRARARVGILGVTSYQWIVVDLACLANGYLTVPLDPEVNWDRARLAATFELDLVLTNCADDNGADGAIVSFDSICAGSAGNAELEPACFGEDEPFTVIFTSGTSGEPKAIEVRKGCFDDQFSNALRMFEITARDRMLVFLPMHIYLERCYVYLSILRGFSVVVAPPHFIVKALKTAVFTFTVGVPYFFKSLQDLFLLQVKTSSSLRLWYLARSLLDRIGLGFAFRKPFAPFHRMLGGAARFLLTGSAPCGLSTLRFYHAMGVPLFEGYGMSEIAGMVALNYPGNTRLGTVGKVFPNKEVKLDTGGQILVRGTHVANTGYWHASKEINAATFLPDGWVATGDVGHFDRDGYLTIDGRIKDTLVLSNGRKVQPEPIEAVLNGTDLVESSMVIGDERPYLVALLCPKSPDVDPRMLDLCLRAINQQRPEGERVKRYQVLRERFTVENGLLNRAFKLNRANIKARYAEQIDALYAP